MYVRSYTPAPRNYISRPKPLGLRKLWLSISVIIAVAAVFHFWPNQVQAIDTHPELAAQLGTLFKQYPDVRAGVALIDVDDDTSYSYGARSPFTAASTTKVLTAADFLHEMEQRKYTLDMPLGVSTAGWQLREMVNQSDNDSWHLFTDLLGQSQLQNYARQLELASYDVAGNTITPLDEAELLHQLYQGKLLNKNDTSLLLSYMQHTNDESLIPAALPASATVYHKYGELVDSDDDSSGNFVHDAAIVTYHGKTFVLTIYTDNPMKLNITSRQQLIHQITRDVIQSES